MFTREMLDGRCGEASGAKCVRTRGSKCGEISDGRFTRTPDSRCGETSDGRCGKTSCLFCHFL